MIALFFFVLTFRLINGLCYYEGFDPENPTNASCVPPMNKMKKQYDYYGRKNTTAKGGDCCAWIKCREVDKDVSPDSFNDHNYCRSVMKSGQTEKDVMVPWCYDSKTKNKELCFEECKKEICITNISTTTSYEPTAFYTTARDELPVVDTPLSAEKERHTKVGQYIAPLTRIGFWTIIATIIILVVMCALFPLVRMYASYRALTKEGKTDEKHQEAVTSYRILSKIFRENGKTPPPFDKFMEIRNRHGKSCDPKALLED